MNCLNCQKEITGIPGKREKKFCDGNCRAKYGQKKKAEAKKVEKQLRKLSKEQKNNLIPTILPGPLLIPIVRRGKIVDNRISIEIKEEPVKSFADYKAEIAYAGSASEVEKLVRSAEKDTSLADWQKRQIKEYGIAISRSLDF